MFVASRRAGASQKSKLKAMSSAPRLSSLQNFGAAYRACSRKVDVAAECSGRCSRVRGTDFVNSSLSVSSSHLKG